MALLALSSYGILIICITIVFEMYPESITVNFKQKSTDKKILESFKLHMCERCEVITLNVFTGVVNRLKSSGDCIHHLL
jgi:hypothetical protein